MRTAGADAGELEVACVQAPVGGREAAAGREAAGEAAGASCEEEEEEAAAQQANGWMRSEWELK